MTLRERILILSFLAFFGYMGLEYAIYRGIIAPSLNGMENAVAVEQVNRCRKAINEQMCILQDNVVSWAKPDYISRLLEQPDSVEAILHKTDIVLLTDEQGKIYLSKCSQNGPFISDWDGFVKDLKSGKKPFLFRNNQPVYSQKGIVSTRLGPVLAAVSPCRVYESAGAKSACLFTGQFLTKEYVKTLRKQLLIDFSCTSYKPELVQNKQSGLKDSQNSDSDEWVCRRGENILQISGIMRDYEGKPAFIIQTDIYRAFPNQSRASFYLAGYLRLAAVFFAFGALIIVFHSIVVHPVRILIEDIIAIGKGKKLRSRRASSRRNEIGILAMEFDGLLDRLEAAQKKLVEKSFVSGMAEMSSGILHNARNALSPVVSCVERMRVNIDDLSGQKLSMALQEYQNCPPDSSRRHDLERFLLLSMGGQMQFMETMKESLQDISRQVYQIEEMLNGQKAFRGAEKPLESVDLMKLIEDAIELIPQNIRQQVNMKVDRAIENLRPIHVHRVLFLQVLENLLINAGESLMRHKPLYPRIKVSAGVETIDNIEMLHLQIDDNGSGISEEMKKKLFERGVSSKSKGLTGIGLHWCANTITAMKGKIWAESDGSNRGASFHVIIPVLQDKTNLLNIDKGIEHEPELKTQNTAG